MYFWIIHSWKINLIYMVCCTVSLMFFFCCNYSLLPWISKSRTCIGDYRLLNMQGMYGTYHNFFHRPFISHFPNPVSLVNILSLHERQTKVFDQELDSWWWYNSLIYSIMDLIIVYLFYKHFWKKLWFK